MNPNSKVTDEVGMELINRHVVNRDMLVFQFDTLNYECIPITLNKQVSNLEVFYESPSLVLHIKRMIEGRFNRLTAHMDLINLVRLTIECSRTLFVSNLTCLFILRKNPISDCNIFDILLPFVSYKLDLRKNEGGNYFSYHHCIFNLLPVRVKKQVGIRFYISSCHRWCLLAFS